MAVDVVREENRGLERRAVAADKLRGNDHVDATWTLNFREHQAANRWQFLLFLLVNLLLLNSCILF
jgi:hypothetical protein